MSETFEVPCRPVTLRRFVECVGGGTPEAPHAVHRKVTDEVHYVCNCGYSSGWVAESTMLTPSEFIAEHAPTEDVRVMAELGSA